MGKSKFVRTVSALLMLMAFLLPVAPAAAAGVDEQGDVHAANVLGPIINPPYPTTPAQVPVPAIDVQDCVGTPAASNIGFSRYFITVRSTSGLDVTNAVGRLVSLNPTLGLAPVTMSNGDFESQANDGNQPSCVPAVNDGHANDLASPPTNTFPIGVTQFSMVITAGGFVPAVIPLNADANTPPCSTAPLNPVPAAGDPTGHVCLISMGTINMQPLSAPAGRGRSRARSLDRTASRSTARWSC